MRKNVNISNFSHIYFIGVGGIGMSAIARYFIENKKQVAGYDKVSSTITKALEEKGAKIHYIDNINGLDKSFLDNQKTLVVYTPAIPKKHRELQYFIHNNFVVCKRAEVLGLITKNTFSFAVAGTHGKTTTSSILGYILDKCEVSATSFIGGIAQNYQSNLILGKEAITVVEADEFDRSFMQLSPNFACITSIDADHLDIYGNADELAKTFKDFSKLVSEKLFVREGLPLNGITYGFSEKANYQAKNISVKNGIHSFTVKTSNNKKQEVQIPLLGEHNILNTLAAIAMAIEYGVSLSKIAEILPNFKGIKRRFNLKLVTDKVVVIDDYAHHPTEINAVFKSVNKVYNTAKKVVIFQPHLFSRTKDFIDDFAKSLAQFDQVFLLSIYPARELPIKGVNSNWLKEKIEALNTDVTLLNSVNKIKSKIIVNNQQLIVSILGAGDIGLMVDNITNQFHNNAVKKELC